MINERIFGSPISGQVRKKLEDRQRVAGEVAFGESIEAVYPDKDGKNQADLSSRTPFVRMWTSVKLVEAANVEEVLEEYDPFSDQLDKFFADSHQESVENRAGELALSFPEVKITEINGKEYITYSRPQADFARKTYIIGDYNYQTAYGSVDANASLEEEETETTTAAGDVSDIFPQELKNNPLLKPQSGITSVTSETEGIMGTLKRTVVNFVVHNFEDYDKIFNKYFLKPAATIFVDFGWSSVKNLYNPIDLINSPDINKFLYESNVVPGYEDVENEESVESVESFGEITKHQGDLEVLQGLVVDYSSKILQNGSVECSVTLVSANTALLDFKVDDIMKRHIQHTLTQSTLFLGLTSIFNDIFVEGKFTIKMPDDRKQQSIDLIQLLSNTPNADTTAEELETFKTNLEYYAFLLLGNQNLTPNGNSVRTGVFTNTMEADDIYISWGYCEDIIFNKNFGFGKSVKDINEGVNLQVKIDSSNSFTTWNDIFLERQGILSSVPEEPPVFIFPEWWGGSDPGEEDASSEESIEGGGSYNYINKKYPKLHYNEIDDTQHTTIDENKKRIPIREVFINVEVIIKAFARNNTVRKAIEDILKDVNDSSDTIFNWKIKTGKTDSELEIVDINRPDISQRILDSGVSDSESVDTEPDEFKNMFTFNIMSPNSIVKDYNLEFKLPTGNIGNMYAVQGMSHENTFFPVSDEFDNAIAMNSMDNDSLSIIYEPDLGGFRASQIDAKGNEDTNYSEIYDGIRNLIDTNLYKSSAVRRGDDLLNSKGLFEINPEIEQLKKDKNKEVELSKPQKQEKVYENNIKLMVAQNYKVAKNFKDYYRLRELKEISLNTKANLLPYSLSLTTYGIGSIVPGDTFRVDYLPQLHFKNTYLQTIKIINNINSDGWYTTLDTQYRLTRKTGGDNKTKQYFTYDRDDIYLSPKTLNTMFSNDKKLTDIIPYMYQLKVINLKGTDSNYDMILQFQVKSDGLIEEYPVEVDNYNSGYGINPDALSDDDLDLIEEYFGILDILEDNIWYNTEDGINKVVFPNVGIGDGETYNIVFQSDKYFVLPESEIALISVYDKPLISTIN